jgi:hypothetical protein
MRYASKRDLLEQIETEHRALVELVGSIPATRLRETGVWGDGWTVQDLLAHLTAWEQLCLGWYRAGLEGGNPTLPAPGYKWGQTPALNRALWSRDRRKSLARVRTDFDASHAEILALARRLSERDLLAPGSFAWTRANPFATYLGANTCSHYRWAQKVLKRWLRGARRPTPEAGIGPQ